jgi:hypothetical protein
MGKRVAIVIAVENYFLSTDQRGQHSHAKRAGFQFTRHHANCYYVRLTCNGRLHKVPGCSVSRVRSHRST